MNIKRNILELCDYMIDFWDGLAKEIEAIPNEDKAELVCRWYGYFEESMSSVRFSETKVNVERVKEYLIMKGELKYEN